VPADVAVDTKGASHMSNAQDQPAIIWALLSSPREWA
jgi:hypothetical protein